MTSQRRAAGACLLAVIVIAGCWDPGDGSRSSDQDVRYAFVVMGENGRASARAITAGATCPFIAFDGGRPAAMSLRAAAATLPPRPTELDKHNTVPTEFPVTVCDAPLPAGVRRATIGSREVPVPRAHPRKIVVIGDTGCRMKKSDFQACNDREQWPFATVVASAVAQAPDLVVHVGDYHYRESPCPAGDAGCAGSPAGFSWPSWDMDFFAPAQPLLAAAPWVMTRGNHETCDRGGQGWWRFIAAVALVAPRDCNDPAYDDVGNYSDPFVVPFDIDAAFLVFDSSIASDDTPLSPADPQVQLYAAQLARVFAAGAGDETAFFVNHQPVLGFISEGGHVAGPGNLALQSILTTMFPQTMFPGNVQASFAGHIHTLQIVGYATAQPATFVPGNGGTALASELKEFPPGKAPVAGAVVDPLVLQRQFGFMTFERSSSGWTVTSFDRYGGVITTCVLVARKTACAPLAAG